MTILTIIGFFALLILAIYYTFGIVALFVFDAIADIKFTKALIHPLSLTVGLWYLVYTTWPFHISLT